MINDRLRAMRKRIKTHGFDGYIVPSCDEYLSEYVPPYAKRLEFITGFTGSNGLAIILKDIVLFFTDGRYITQAYNELDPKLFKIFDQQSIPNFNWHEYIDENIVKDATIAYDPKLFTLNALKKFLPLNLKIHLPNLIDEIWESQPPHPNSIIFDYPVQYAGLDWVEKILKCRKVLQQEGADAMVVSDSASVCWLLNVRASDVEFSPLLLANMIITHDKSYLFTDSKRFEKALTRENVAILPPNDFSKVIDNIEGLIIYDENQCSSYIASIITSTITSTIGQKTSKSINNPCLLWKACKNNIEIEHMLQGHTRDAIAMCEFLSFIAQNDISSQSEYDLALKLTDLRSKGQNYIYDSFPTICGFQGNGAIIHYRALQESAKKIDGDGLLLIDSGGQYLGATTDITRTILIGNARPEYAKLYTRVLKGHIALAKCKFPANRISGSNLDILARQYLWQEGLDYAHGTGHGVGAFLSVHEGPQNIHLKSNVIMEAGMIVSNEPGYYLPEKFGIRIENLMFIKESPLPDFLEFQMLTLVPYAKELIDFTMLNKDEYLYLKTYYDIIEEKILPLLSPKAQSWLKAEIKLPVISRLD